MEQPEKVKLNFNKPLLTMLEDSQTMHDNFVIDEPDFIVKFPTLAPPFAANWQTAIDAADALPGNDAVLAQIGLLTQELDQEMLQARNQYQSLLLYVKLAYPKDDAVLKMFGQNLYVSARDNQLEMIELLELASAQANVQPYKAALIAKGFTQVEITLLKTIELSLRSKNKAQEAAISKRPFATQTQHKACNAVWAMNVLVNTAAELVYKDDYAKQQQYLLYPDAGGGAPPVTPGITITTDQTIPSAIVIVDIMGTPLATGGEIRITWEPGITESATLIASATIDFTHTYTTPGIKTITVTPVTPGVFSTIEALVIASNKITAASMPNEINNVKTIDASNNNFDAPTVNAMLLWLDNNNITGGTCNLTGGANAAPTGAGITAKNNLTAKGWAVSTN